MQDFLTLHEEAELRKQHHRELGRKSADRMKVVLLANAGWKYSEIGDAMLLHPDTIVQHVQDYVENKKLKLESGGKDGKLVSWKADPLAGSCPGSGDGPPALRQNGGYLCLGPNSVWRGVHPPGHDRVAPPAWIFLEKLRRSSCKSRSDPAKELPQGLRKTEETPAEKRSHCVC